MPAAPVAASLPSADVAGVLLPHALKVAREQARRCAWLADEFETAAGDKVRALLADRPGGVTLGLLATSVRRACEDVRRAETARKRAEGAAARERGRPRRGRAGGDP